MGTQLIGCSWRFNAEYTRPFRSEPGRERIAISISCVRFAHIALRSCFNHSCFEDNSRVKEAVAEPGEGRVLLIDGGGSLAKALTGDLVAKSAMDNGWAGMVIIGAARDVEVINTFDFCVMALGTTPLKTEKLGRGERGVVLTLGGVDVSEGDYLAGDENGVLISRQPFLES